MPSLLNKTREEIIALLRDDDYYYDPKRGGDYLSASTLKKYIKGEQDKPRQEGFIHPLAYGNAVHKACLEPEKFEEIQWAPIGTIDALTLEDRENALRIKDAVYNNKVARDILEASETIVEEPHIGEYDGIKLKCKVDIETPDKCWDIKTTGSISRYKYLSKRFGYPMSAYQYYYLTRKPMDYIVVDKTTFEVQIHQSDTHWYREGRNEWLGGIELYKKHHNL